MIYANPCYSSIAQKIKFSIKDFSTSKCDQIRSFLPIWLHLLKKSVTENFISCAVQIPDAVWDWNLKKPVKNK